MPSNDAAAPFRILMVCTGNICRSPLAERLLQVSLDRLAPGQFDVVSAGTAALTGLPMDAQAAAALHRLGGTSEGFAARQLTAAILEGPELVLTMTREQRSAVVQISPARLRSTFTLREFARILARAGGEPASSGVPGSSVVSASSVGPGTDGEPDTHVPASGLAPASPAERWRELLLRAPRLPSLVPAAEPADNDVVDPYRRKPAIYRAMESQLAPAVEQIVSWEAQYHKTRGQEHRRPVR